MAREAQPRSARGARRGRRGDVAHAPKKRLKRVLRALDALLVSKLPVHDAAHGFVKGRSVKTNAERHVGRAVVVKLDLKDFFPTVTFARVRGLLVALGNGYAVAPRRPSGRRMTAQAARLRTSAGRRG